MKELDINSFLNKAEELKALFVLGQRVIPFLEEIFLFVKEIKPLLDDINNSIEDNLKKMPNASKQLSKVTEATETATTEIMDVIDGIFYKSDLIESNLNKLKETHLERTANPLKVYEIIQKAITDDVDIQELVPQLTSTISEMKHVSVPKDSEGILNQTSEITNSIKDDANSIMMALQVQDITSQQIAAVNHLLETIQGKLSAILSKFQHNGISDIAIEANSYKEKTNVSSLHRQVAFDPDAVDALTNKATRQDDVDELIKQAKKNELSFEEESSEIDIDALFNAQANEPVIDDGPVSQDDIDALFGK